MYLCKVRYPSSNKADCSRGIVHASSRYILVLALRPYRPFCRCNEHSLIIRVLERTIPSSYQLGPFGMDSRDDSSWDVASQLPPLVSTSIPINLTVTVYPRSVQGSKNRVTAKKNLLASSSFLYSHSESSTTSFSTLYRRTKGPHTS